MAAKSLPQIKIQNTGGAQTNVPFTFGHVFAAGDLAPTDGLTGGALPLQVDVKATHADGSVRHAILSGVLPTLGAGETVALQLAKAVRAPGPRAALTELTDFPLAAVAITVGGAVYGAKTTDAESVTQWVAGDIVGEWFAPVPLKNAAGQEHPNLTARFGLRYFPGTKQARVEFVIENTKTWVPAVKPIYDVDLQLNGGTVFSRKAIEHYHHARWRQVFWTGDAPQIHVQHDSAYLMASKAVPNYDTSIPVSEEGLAALQKRWASVDTGPMALGIVSPYMPMTGGRDDIGILPSWAAMLVLSQDARAKQVTLGTGDLAGSWSIHYRDEGTGRPVTVHDHPYMTIQGRYGDTWNPTTNKMEGFPFPADEAFLVTPYTQDSAHQPNLSYFPYLLTGDHYYLEELQFWAAYNTLAPNPNYRQFAKGLYQDGEVRAQAWNMRTAAEAAYITPDSDPLKSYFLGVVDNNLDWYNATYTGASSNALGVITNGYAYSYDGDNGIAPWQDDFFTAAIGHTYELGFAKAKPLLEWKSKFPIQRMTGKGMCWVSAADYSMVVRPNTGSPVFGSIEEVYKATKGPTISAMGCGSPEMAAALGLKPGEMANLSDASMGYPSNMQPALAVAADYGGGADAWNLFMARSVKPDYSWSPQFSIVPRTVKTTTVALPIAPTVVPDPVVKISADPGAGTWKKAGAENDKISLPIGSQIRYGAEGKGYVYATTTAKEFTATNAAFGRDPVPNVVKVVDVFAPAKPAKIKTSSNTLLKKLTGLVVKVVDPKTLQIVSNFSGVTASSTGIITVSGPDLTAKAIYAVVVENAAGKVLDIMFPVTATA